MRHEIEIRKMVAPGIMLVKYIRRVVIRGRVMYQGRTYPVNEDKNGLYIMGA